MQQQRQTSCIAVTSFILYRKKKRYGIIKKSKFLENGASEAEKIYPNGHSYIVQSYKRVFFLYFGVVSNENQHTYGRRAVMMVNESSSHTEKEKREEKRNRRLFRFSSSFTLPRFAFPLSYSVNQSRERERSSHSTLLNFHINVTHITV